MGQICFALFGYNSPCNDCPVVPVFSTGRASVREKQLVEQDGSIRWNEVRAYPVFGKGNEVHLVITIGRDITDRKRAELAKDTQSGDGTFRLTERQAEVLKLVAEGHTNAEIASFLYLSPHTVKRHITNLFNILDVNDRTQAAILAVKHGLI